MNLDALYKESTIFFWDAQFEANPSNFNCFCGHTNY